MPFENQTGFGRTQRERVKESLQCVCEHCGNQFPKKELQIHHNYIWKSEAKYHHIPGKFVVCTENAKVLCPGCHTKLHQELQRRPTHMIIDGIITIGISTGNTVDLVSLVTKIRKNARDHFFSVVAPVHRS